MSCAVLVDKMLKIMEGNRKLAKKYFELQAMSAPTSMIAEAYRHCITILNISQMPPPTPKRR